MSEGARLRRIVVVLIATSLLFSVAAAMLSAQERTGEMQSIGLERVMHVDADEGISMIMLRHTGVRTSRPGFDIGLGIVPYERGAVFVFDAGAAWSIPGELATAHLRVGGSVVMAMIPGFYGGVGLTIPVARQLGVRFDATHRTYLVPGYGSGSVWSVGAGVALISRSDRK